MVFCHVQKSLSHRNKYDLLGGYQYQIRIFVFGNDHIFGSKYYYNTENPNLIYGRLISTLENITSMVVMKKAENIFWRKHQSSYNIYQYKYQHL